MSPAAYWQHEISIARPGSIAIDMTSVGSNGRAASPQPVQPASRQAFIGRNHTGGPVERTDHLPLILQHYISSQFHGVHPHRSRAADGRLRLTCIEDIQAAAPPVLITRRSVERATGSAARFGKTTTIGQAGYAVVANCPLVD